MRLRGNTARLPSRFAALQGLIAISLAALGLHFFGTGGPLELDLTSSAAPAGQCLYGVFMDDKWLGAVFSEEPQSATRIVSGMLGKIADTPQSESPVVPCGCKVVVNAAGSHVRTETLKGDLLVAAGKPVDLNRADEADLAAIPGIGPALASRIIAFREAQGPFNRVEDLMLVPGIGKKKLTAFQPFITTRARNRTSPDEGYPETILSPLSSNAVAQTSFATQP
ncbi:MAG: helix-hairpin-helix domain-containing protein [Thermodesulfobacteriota bacterium]